MKKSIIALAAAGLVTLGSAAQAGDVEAGKAAYSTCMGCHGAAGEGAMGPKLAGVPAAETAAKLRAYKNGETVGPMTAMMAPLAMPLSDADIDNIAAYTAGL